MNQLYTWLAEEFSAAGLPDAAAHSLAFFLYETAFLSVVLVAGITFFSYIRIKFFSGGHAHALAGRSKPVVYAAMALLGIVSPFCSCSAIPAFIALSSMAIPTGALFVYLVTAPLVQETSFILLVSEFGPLVAFVYVAFGTAAGVLAGLLLSRSSDEDIFVESVLATRGTSKAESFNADDVPKACSCSCSSSSKAPQPHAGGSEFSEVDSIFMQSWGGEKAGSCCIATSSSVEDAFKKLDAQTITCSCSSSTAPKANAECGCSSGRILQPAAACSCGSVLRSADESHLAAAFREAAGIIRKTFKYILIGVALGSLIHGVVPNEWIEKLLGSENYVAPIYAALIGIPIYADDVALIPVAKSLIDSGAALGTSLSFVMASAVVSLPSFILLAGVLQKKVIAKLAVVLTIMIIVIGYLFNFLEPILL